MTARKKPAAAKKRTPKKSGAPFGNQNAKGRKGGAPLGNKRAVTTGEFERIFFDSISDDERLMMREIALDKIRILRDELILLTIREQIGRAHV